MLHRIPKRLKRRVLLIAGTGFGLCLILLTTLWYAFPFPMERLDQLAVSPRVTDHTGRVLLTLVGPDDHWRNPVSLTEISPWLRQATIAAEDARFDSHCGVDPLAVSRALLQNLKSRQVVSGASTLTMQLCRMLDQRPRTLTSKLIESVRAVQVEQRLSKNRILEHYLNLAPYGGNVRGVEAASRRYFGRSCRNLSLGQAALLAGLPQSPARYRPDRFPQAAATRRLYVLKRMHRAGMISSVQKDRPAAEAVRLHTASVAAGPCLATHAAWMALQQRPAGGRTGIDTPLQAAAEFEVGRHTATLPAGSDVAVVVIEIPTAKIRALIGSSDAADPVDGQNNGVLARRSPGSALKPFLYAAAFDAQRLNADSIVPDTPIERAGWQPDNFDHSFRGTMTVADALRESRNVPAIRVTEAMGVSRCLGVLQSCGIRMPGDARTRGGLAVAVGVIETTLLDLTNAYATLGRDGICQPAKLFQDARSPQHRALTASTCRTLNDILSTRTRVPRGFEEMSADRLPWFMWKTGTSSGRRDAWAIGHNGRWAIGVWVGRFSGSGHTEFVGRTAAEPLLATLFALPGIRTDQRPAVPQTVPVNLPLRFAQDRSRGPIIRSPGRSAEFLCLGTSVAHVPVEVRDVPGTTWFLNRRVLSGPREDMLTLARGHYELRCVAQDGSSDAVNFTVR